MRPMPTVSLSVEGARIARVWPIFETVNSTFVVSEDPRASCSKDAKYSMRLADV